MNFEQTEQFDLNNLKRILLRRKWLIISVLVGITSLAIGINKFSTPIYKANTTIVFEEQSAPVATINTVKIALNEGFIIKQIEEIKSRSLAEEVVAKLPEEIVDTFPLPGDPAPGFEQLEYIAGQIKKGISASSINNSEVIRIEVEAYTPTAAKVIANTVADVLKARKLAVRQEETSEVRSIIEEQLVTFKKQLDEAESALKQFKEQNKVTVIDKEAEEIFKRITEAETIYNQAKANLDATEQRVQFIQNKLATERKDLVPTITKVTSPWAQKLKQQLVELEVQYTTLKLQDYTEDHPKMLKLKKQIEEAKSNLKQESLKIAAGESLIDPLFQIQKLMEESVSLEIEIQTLQAQEKTLKNVINNYKWNLNGLPDKELRLAQLMRDKEVNEKIYTMLLQKREEAKIAEAEKAGNIRIIDQAATPAGPAKPRKALNLFLAIILGITLGIGMAFFLEYLDQTVKTVYEAEQLAELSVLGAIPKIELINRKTSKTGIALFSTLISEYNPQSTEAEAFRHLKANLQLTGVKSSLKTILITSVNPGEGKSLIISNLSIATAQMGLRTLLIDADLKKPTLHTIFQRKNKPGLTDMLLSKNGSANYEMITSTRIKNLDLLTSGTIPLASSEILASLDMKWLIGELKKRYNLIFIDTPPINLVPDAGILNAIVDGSILVIKVRSTSASEIKRAIKQLKKAQDNILGTVINYIDPQNGYSNKYYYYYSDNYNGKKVREHKKAQILTLN